MSLTSPPAQNAFPPVPRITSSFGSSPSSPPSPRPVFVGAALEGKCSSRASCIFRSIPMERAFMRSGTLRVRRATPRPSPRISRVTSCRAATKRAGKPRRRAEQRLRGDGRRHEHQRLESLTVRERMVPCAPPALRVRFHDDGRGTSSGKKSSRAILKSTSNTEK